MALQPCVECGELTDRNRCSRHRIVRPRAAKTNSSHVAFKNNAKWKRLSKKLRKLSPFCEICGTSDDLTVDHIVRVHDRPEWTYEPDNCRILCRYHNGKLASIPATAEVENEIERKITRTKSERARRLLEANGGLHQEGDGDRPRGKAKFGLVSVSTIEEEE